MNEKEFEFLGIKKFHDAGILGQGITVASIENGYTTHSKKVLDILRQILPKATILTSIKYWDDNLPKLDGYTCSQERAGSDKKELVEKQKEMYEKNVFMTCAVGNESDYGSSPMAKYNEWVSVGACKLRDGKVEPEYYSSESEYLDFMSLTDLKTSEGRFSGTSCATPVLQGMAMLVKCLYKNKFNKNITNSELYEFIRRNCVDIGDNGLDVKCGNGLFILPDPSEIEDDNMEIILKIGEKKAVVNGKEIELDVAPKIENDRTLVPLRFIAENLDCNVEWDSLTKSVIITN